MSFLNQVLFNIGSDAVTPAEILGFITGIITVYLIVKEKVWNFPIGILNNIFFLVLFLNAKLYADAWLQVVYVVITSVGWWAWLRAGPNHTALRVGTATRGQFVAVVIAGLAGLAILWPVLVNSNDVAPFWDASTTSLSLGAQALLNFKKIQNWYLWIVADIIYIPLYFFKDLYLTAGVYMIFLCLATAGLLRWRRVRDEQTTQIQVS